jgi:hypothetical protein
MFDPIQQPLEILRQRNFLLSRRHHLQSSSDLKNRDRTRPQGTRRLPVHPQDNARIGYIPHECGEDVGVQNNHRNYASEKTALTLEYRRDAKARLTLETQILPIQRLCVVQKPTVSLRAAQICTLCRQEITARRQAHETSFSSRNLIFVQVAGGVSLEISRVTARTNSDGERGFGQSAKKRGDGKSLTHRSGRFAALVIVLAIHPD